MKHARIVAVDSFRVPPRWIFVRVRCDDGTEGWGEAIVPKRPEAVVGALKDLAANVVGEDAGRVEELWQRMYRGAFYRGGPVLGTAAAGVEQALWDAKGQRYGLPVYELLGGAVRDRIRAYAWIGGDVPVDAVAAAQERIAEGYRAVKMNVAGVVDHLEPRSVVDAVVGRVAALPRSACGPDLGIALDFHGRVPLVTARALLRELEPFSLMWVEEPVTPGCDEALRDLRRVAGATPIAAGERHLSRWEFARLLADRLVDVLQPDVSLTGLFELEKICRMAELHDVAVAPHCPNGPVSLAASLQVGFCCANVVVQEHSQGIHYHQGFAGLPRADAGDYLRGGSLSLQDGHFERSEHDGLGIDLDHEAVASLAEDWHLPDPVWRHADGRLAEW